MYTLLLTFQKVTKGLNTGSFNCAYIMNMNGKMASNSLAPRQVTKDNNKRLSFFLMNIINNLFLCLRQHNKIAHKKYFLCLHTKTLSRKIV